MLRIDRAKGCFRVISTEILPKITSSQMLEKYQIPFNFRMRVPDWKHLGTFIYDHGGIIARNLSEEDTRFIYKYLVVATCRSPDLSHKLKFIAL